MKIRYVIIERDGEEENTQGFFDDVLVAIENLESLEKEYPSCVFHIQVNYRREGI